MTDTLADPRQSNRSADNSAWLQRVARFGLPALPVATAAGTAHPWECNYDTALEVLDELEAELGADHPYLNRWAENQNRVLGSCSTGTRIPLIEISQSDKLPPRAAADLAYQNTSVLFYTRMDDDFAKLETEYLTQAQQAGSSMQAQAATMALRMAYMTGGLAHLLEVAQPLRENPATTKAYAYAEDTIFTVYWMYATDQEDAVALGVRLQWLVDTALERNVPVFSGETSTQQNFREWRRRDARYQLDGLISPGKLSKQMPAAGWWFSATVQNDPNRESVRQIAHREPYVDFLATHFVRTPLTSWRWALYDTTNAVWKHSKIISDHALDRFCSGGGAEWLNEAARLMSPGDPEITWTKEQIIQSLGDIPFHQRQPYLRGQLYQQAVRLSLLEGDDDGALTLLLRKDINYIGKNGSRQDNNQYTINPNDDFKKITANVLEETLAWYAHQGKWEPVRKIIQACDEQKCNTRPAAYWNHDVTQIYRVMTAGDLDSMLKALRRVDDADIGQIYTLFDLLPLSTLVEIAERSTNNRQAAPLKAKLVSQLLLRAWVLEDTSLLHRAINVYLARFPEQKDTVLRAFSGDRFDQALFVLRHQRNADNQAQNPFDGVNSYSLLPREKTKDLHNWSGLWCQFQPDDYPLVSAALWEFPPAGAQLDRSGWSGWSGWYDMGLTYNAAKFAEQRQLAFMDHPLWKLSDADELQRLADVAPGPQYLTDIVNSYARWPTMWNRFMGRADEIPEALHLATRTARYGCHRDNDYNYAASSHTAYRILHKDFGDTLWAHNTPYWYK